MTDSPHAAGRPDTFRRWPTDPAQLTDTTLCPACFTQLTGPVCGRCGLDLSDPRSADLLRHGQAILAAEDARQSLIAGIRSDQQLRYEQAAAAHARAEAQAITRTSAQAVWNAAVPPQPAPPFPQQPATLFAPQPTPDASPPAPTRERSHSSVQIVLLIVGVSLVSVAAIFFLTVAWVLTGLGVRSVIVAAATLAALAVATLLRRRKLTATAEGIGALGVVLVLLDLWAIRGNDLFGAGDAIALLYWGVGLLTSVALFFVVHRISALRVAGLAVFALTPLALGLLAGGIAEPLDTAAQVTVAALAAAIGCALTAAARPSDAMLLPVIGRAAERIVLTCVAFGALAVATVAACFAGPDADWSPFGWLILVAAVALGHAMLALRTGRSIAIGAGYAAVAVVTVELIAPVITGRAHDATAFVAVCTLVAAALALALEAAIAGTASRVRTAVTVAAITASAIAGFWLLICACVAAVPLGQALFHGATATHRPFVEVQPVYGWALATLVTVGACTAVTWWLIARLRRRRVALVWFACMVVVLAVPFLVLLPAVVTGFVALAVIGCVLSIVATRRIPAPRASFAPLLTLLIVAQGAAFVTGFASSSTWWIGTVSAVVLLYAARHIARGENRSVARPILTSAAAVIALFVTGVAPWMLTLQSVPGASATVQNVIGGVTFGVGLLALVAATPWRRFLRPQERCVLFWTLAPVALLFLVPPLIPMSPGSPTVRGGIDTAAVLQPEPLGGIVRVGLLAAALVLWLTLAANRARGFRRQRRAAGAALAPVLALFAATVARAANANDQTVVIIVASAALVVVAAGLGIAFVRSADVSSGRDPVLRRALDGGSALVMAVAVVLATLLAVDVVWFILLLAAAALLLASIATDGLFGSASDRRYLGWAALVFGVAALWMRLSSAQVDIIEVYVLPVTAALLSVSALLYRYGAPPRSDVPRTGVAMLVFAGLLISAVPLSLAAQSGAPVRAIIVGGSAAVFLLTVASLRRTTASRPFVAAVGLPSALAVLLIGSGRAAGVALQTPLPIAFDLWLGCAGAVLCAAGVLTTLGTRADRTSEQSTDATLDAEDAAAQASVAAPILIGLGLALWFVPVALAGSTGPIWRPILVLVLGAVVSATAAALRLRPLWGVVSWTALAVGLAGACITAGGRILSLFGTDGPVDGRLEAWLVPALAVVAAAAIPLGSGGAAVPPARNTAPLVAEILLIGALTATLVVELTALGFAPLTLPRVLLLTWMFSAVHAVTFWFDRRPLTPMVGWVAIVMAAVAAIAGSSRLAPTPFELATVPIAAALLISGGLHLMRAPAARSWPRLGPGIAMLLLPSLIVGLSDAPLWRVVALGVASIAVLAVGLVMRLQAPFLIGCAVALMHALVQLWPWIAAAYEATQWWLWVGMGGILLITLAARYEHRIRDLKAAVGRISALR